MNGNTAGARTLAYLRGEKDLSQEREQLGQAKKQLQDKGMAIGLSEAQKRRVERFWRVASLLRENSRMSLTDMSRQLKISVSTLFDTLKEVEKYFHFTIVLKEGETVVSVRDAMTFEFGYQVSTETSSEKETQCTLSAE